MTSKSSFSLCDFWEIDNDTIEDSDYLESVDNSPDTDKSNDDGNDITEHVKAISHQGHGICLVPNWKKKWINVDQSFLAWNILELETKYSQCPSDNVTIFLILVEIC